MKQFNIVFFRFGIMLGTVGLLGLTGCTVEEVETPVTPGKPEGAVTIELTVPEFDIPVTRSIEENKGEAVVKTIDLLIFDKQTSPPMLLHRYKATNIRQSASAPYYKVSFDVSLDLMENAGMLAVIANASDAVDLAQTNPGGITNGDKKKSSIMSWLRYIIDPDENGGSYKWNATETGYTPIPMYGEMTVDGITPGMTLTGIELTRMLARIDVENKVNGSTFQLQEIFLVNYEGGGFVAPKWNNATGTLLKEGDEGYIYSNNGSPSIPDTAPSDLKPSTEDTAIKYTYTQSDHAAGPLLEGEIYAFEAMKEPLSDPSHRMGLVLKGLYKGAPSYYRVDFTTNKGGSLGASEVEFMPLYRNHKYTVTITDAEGVGYKSFDEALNSSTVLSNLKTTIFSVNMSGINDIVYDGQYYMGVESRDIEVVWGVSKDFNYTVSTNYDGPWEAEILDPSAHTWLSFPGNETTTDGTNLNASGLPLNVQALASLWNGSNYVEDAQIRLTAGRLQMILNVKRVPIAKLFARSNVVLRESKLTFAVSRQDNQIIPAYSQGVFFKWGSLIALGPAGIPYTPGTHVVYNPTGLSAAGWGTGLAGWDNIPYAHTDFQYTGSSVGGNAHDDFETYESGAGFNKSKGIGDICRYISSEGNGKTKWVEGEWRLPTYAEIQMLYAESRVTKSGGMFTNLTASLNAAASGYQTGFFNPNSGWWIGAEVTSSTNDMATPPDATVFLPMAGHRYPNGEGDVVHAGIYGYYWTATPYDGITVNYPWLNSAGTEFYDADRSYAFPIRCIRNH